MLLPVSHDELRHSNAGSSVSTRSSSSSPSLTDLPLSDIPYNGPSTKGFHGGGRAHKQSRRFGGNGPGAQVFRTCSTFPEYFARVLDYRQMDLDATFYQMVTLCVQPSKVYKSAYYRKQTRNRWARDDPAFAVIQLVFLLVATIAWAVAFQVNKVSSYLSLLFHAVVVEWLGFGLVIATLCWWIANHFLRLRGTQGIGDTFFVEQRVEWQFAFDIHCNSFFVLFLFLYVVQFLLAPLLASESFLALVVANALYAVGWGLYVYITFLGYMALPFLHKTERFLSPIVAIAALFLTSLVLKLILGTALNFSHISTSYYYST